MFQLSSAMFQLSFEAEVLSSSPALMPPICCNLPTPCTFRLYHNKWIVLLMWVFVMAHLFLVCFEHPNGSLNTLLAPSVSSCWFF